MTLTMEEIKEALKIYFPTCKIENTDSKFVVTINVKKFVNLFIMNIEGENITFGLKLNSPVYFRTIDDVDGRYQYTGTSAQIIKWIEQLLDYYCFVVSKGFMLDKDQIRLIYSKEDISALVQYFVCQFNSKKV